MTRPSAVSPETAGLLARARRGGALSRSDLADIVSMPRGVFRDAVLAAAYETKVSRIGRRVSLRGLVETGNICAKNCFYCGLRRGNAACRRYRLDADAIVRMARRAHDLRYGSVVLQGGEIESGENTALVERVVRAIREFAPEDGFAVVLSLGEQTDDVYRRWKNAGATRYLLRIETSNPELYKTLHPSDHSWTRRRDCLRSLRSLGYQLGSGVMIGLPGQTADDLAGDLMFFRDEDVDMIGMGPFLPHPDTPLGKMKVDESEQLRLGVNMVAAARLFLPDRNIAATTVLQNLAPDGREQALLAGANVLMPNVTDLVFRRAYELYRKPVVDEVSGLSGTPTVEERVRSIGEEIAWDSPGTPEHFALRSGASRQTESAVRAAP